MSVVIITGAGDSFCVGLDLNDVRERGECEPEDTRVTLLNELQTYPFQISGPVICAINGAAGGFGAAYPLTCDIRLAATEANIAFSFVKWGLIPEMGTTGYYQDWLASRRLRLVTHWPQGIGQ